MVEEYELVANLRSDEKAAAVRNDSKIPAIIYGKDFENQKISVDGKIFNKVFTEAGESALIKLKVDDQSPIKVLVSDSQIHPVTGQIIHVDFYKVNMKEKIRTNIPLEMIGESLAVLDLEGSLVTNKDEVEVECLPNDLVHEIEVDISVLKTFDDVIKVSDLKVPAGIEILDEPEEVVVLVNPPRSEEELEALDEAPVEDIEAVEVETKEGAVEGEEEASDKSDSNSGEVQPIPQAESEKTE